MVAKSNVKGCSRFVSLCAFSLMVALIGCFGGRKTDIRVMPFAIQEAFYDSLIIDIAPGSVIIDPCGPLLIWIPVHLESDRKSYSIGDTVRFTLRVAAPEWNQEMGQQMTLDRRTVEPVRWAIRSEKSELIFTTPKVLTPADTSLVLGEMLSFFRTPPPFLRAARLSFGLSRSASATPPSPRPN